MFKDALMSISLRCHNTYVGNSIRMSFGSRIVSTRKTRKISQGELALAIGVHANVLGKYERDETIPSIKVAAKIAKTLDVSLDYLVELTDTELDSTVLSRINDISSLTDDDRQQVFTVVDALVRDFKAKK